MTLDEARSVLRAFRVAREALPDAVAVAWRSGVPKAEIARDAGLSREGVRRMLARARK